jgi:hypothetical protein
MDILKMSNLEVPEIVLKKGIKKTRCDENALKIDFLAYFL